MVREFLRVREKKNQVAAAAAAAAAAAVAVAVAPGSGAPKKSPVDGNALLHMVGHWMFQAVRADRQSFDGMCVSIRIHT